MSAVVCFSKPTVAGNTSIKFESTDGEVYVLKFDSFCDDDYYYPSVSILTLEWKQQSTKFISVRSYRSESLEFEKNIFVDNKTSARVELQSEYAGKITVHVFHIPYVPLKESLPNTDSNSSSASTKKEPVMEKKLEQLSTEMNHLLDSGNFSDVVLTDGSNEIPAHKNILSARSSVFAKMLLHPMKESKENRITIEDTSMEILRELLHFMYSGTVKIEDSEKARELYVAADKYDVQALRGICSSILKSVDMENVLQTLVLADLYNDKVLKEAALKFIFKNYSQLKTEEKWSTFMKEHQALAIEMLSFMMDKK